MCHEGGTNPSNPDFSQLIVSGTATLAGTLDLSLLTGFFPDPRETFTIISAGTRSGTYAAGSPTAVSSAQVIAPARHSARH